MIDSRPTFHCILRCSSKKGMVPVLAPAEINYRHYLDSGEAHIFLWLEFTCDVESLWVDYWINYWEKWFATYYPDPLNHIGLITNVGMREPYRHEWNRIRRIYTDNTMQALMTYHSINNHPVNQAGFAINGRMLFLTGKPLTVNRLPVLDLIDRGILNEHTTASLFWNPSLYHVIEPLGITQDRARELVNKYQGSPDNLTVDARSVSGHFHSAGMPYDPSMYAQHQLCLIPETTVAVSYMYNYCTEKTYRTMLNRMPFIILGQPGTIPHLESRGYRTFTQYLPYPDYNDWDITTIERLREHWPKIEQNCLTLLSRDCAEQLREDCEHNYNRLQEENQQMIETVNQATHGQVLYDLESYNKFNWGPQPPGFSWPIPLPGNT